MLYVVLNYRSFLRMKNGVEVPTGVRSRYRVKAEGTKHFLVIDDASREDTGTYSIMASGGTSEAHVQVDCMYHVTLFCDFCIAHMLFKVK